MDWTINVYQPTGAYKTTYNNVSPGGIVNSISWEVEPSGNCLSGSFEGIPAQLNISPRDLIRIYIDDVPKYFGYVSSMPNENSKYIGKFELEGMKKLYYETLVDRFWYSPTGTNLTASGLVKHSSIINALAPYRPSGVEALPLNNASTTSGNKPPIVAQDFPLGDIIDSIINSAADGERYHWGVNMNKQMFVVKESSFTDIDFTSVDKKVDTTQQNVDDTVTAIRFVFSVPDGYYHPDLGVNSYTAVDPSYSNVQHFKNFAPISYDYVDTTAAATYGKITKTVPLILTDTWMKLVSFNDAAAMDANVTIDNEKSTVCIWDYMRTNTGSSSFTDMLTAISTPGTSTYIRSNILIDYSRWLTLTLNAGPSDKTATPTHVFDLKGLIGFYFRAGVLTTERPITWYSREFYAKTPGVAGTPDFDYNIYFPPIEANYSFTDVKIYTLLPKPALTEWQVDPDSVNTSGFKNADLRAVSSSIYLPTRLIGVSYSGEDIPISDFRVYEWFCLFLNTEALDGYASTMIQTPEDYPSTITVKEDLGLGFVAVIDSVEGVESAIVKVSYELSVDTGFTVKYTTGRDEARSNQFLTRLMSRDSSATNSAVRVAGTRV